MTSPPERRQLAWREATNFGSRLRGLLFAPTLRPGQALWIRPCNAVHTFGMAYAIDVVFLDAAGTVLRVVPALAPWRVAWHWQARDVVELAAGEAAALGLARGSRLGRQGLPTKKNAAR